MDSEVEDPEHIVINYFKQILSRLNIFMIPKKCLDKSMPSIEILSGTEKEMDSKFINDFLVLYRVRQCNLMKLQGFI